MTTFSCSKILNHLKKKKKKKNDKKKLMNFDTLFYCLEIFHKDRNMKKHVSCLFSLTLDFRKIFLHFIKPTYRFTNLYLKTAFNRFWLISGLFPEISLRKQNVLFMNCLL